MELSGQNLSQVYAFSLKYEFRHMKVIFGYIRIDKKLGIMKENRLMTDFMHQFNYLFVSMLFYNTELPDTEIKSLIS